MVGGHLFHLRRHSWPTEEFVSRSTLQLVQGQISLSSGGGLSFAMTHYPCLEFELMAQELLMSDSTIKESSVIRSDANLGIHGQGLLNLYGTGDVIEAQRLILSLFYSIQVHAYYSFAPLTAYLAVNYLDQFLSTYEILQGKAWMIQLLSMACLSLAAKMEETQVPLSLDLQISESKYVFEAKTIRIMELMVVSTFKWRMQAVTPFSFIDFFLHKFNEDKSPSMALLYQCMELILKVIKGVDFLLFRPSEVAAAVAISLLGESEMVNLEEDTIYCEHVEKL